MEVLNTRQLPELIRLLFVTDAWFPQVNGVVRSISSVKDQLEKEGHHIEMITPEQFWNIPCPTYPEISLAVGSSFKIRKRLLQKDYHAVHIATEGPLGFAARRACIREAIPFTTAFHTRFPEYIEARFGIPMKYLDPIQKWFHQPSKAVMVSTPTFADELAKKGYQDLKIWSRGVDTELFHPSKRDESLRSKAPMFLYVGRVAVEKNIEEFLKLELSGHKVVVGDGPLTSELKQRYPEAEFVGFKKGEELAKYYASADCFVFPSKTDTFGNVMLEALATGTPVAAYPVSGPKDVIGSDGPGVLSEDLQAAAMGAVNISREKCREYALSFSWQKSAEQFLSNLHLLS